MRAALRAVLDSRSNLSAELTAAHRLLRENGYNHVIQAENIADKHFKIFFVRNGKKNARLGMIVGKKTISSAADRNRIKRLIREAFRHNSIKVCGLDLVVMVKRVSLQDCYALVDNLNMLFSKVENRCAEF